MKIEKYCSWYFSGQLCYLSNCDAKNKSVGLLSNFHTAISRLSTNTGGRWYCSSKWWYIGGGRKHLLRKGVSYGVMLKCIVWVLWVMALGEY